MKTLVGLLALMLSACSSLTNINNVQVPEGQTILLRWVQYDTQLEVAKACSTGTRTSNALGTNASFTSINVNMNIQGCYKWKRNTCEIITTKFTKPNGEFDKSNEIKMQVAGHELRHCYEGFFHE